MFKIAIRETGDGLEACNGCSMLPTKPGTETGDAAAEDDDEIELLIFQTGQIIEAEDAGFRTNWDLHDADLAELVIEYRKAEKELKMLFDIRHQLFIKSHFKK